MGRCGLDETPYTEDCDMENRFKAAKGGAVSRSIRPKSGADARAERTLERALGGATDREGMDAAEGQRQAMKRSPSSAPAKSIRPKKNPGY